MCLDVDPDLVPERSSFSVLAHLYPGSGTAFGSPIQRQSNADLHQKHHWL
jgi:hypothetical protein